MEVKIETGRELKTICKEIVSFDKNIEEWAEIEASDMFQGDSFSGGFDATEMEFTFSYYDELSREWWFQLPLVAIKKIAAGEDLEIRASVVD